MANENLLKELPLYRIAQARSGDKGDTCDITVFFHSNELYELAGPSLSADRVKAFLSPLVTGAVERYELPVTGAYKFICHGALDGGGSSSLRGDNLGKSMASALLRMTLPAVPAGLAESSPIFNGPSKVEVVK